MSGTTGNLKLAQKMLDHTDIRTTARYGHATEDDLLEAVTLMQLPATADEKQRA